MDRNMREEGLAHNEYLEIVDDGDEEFAFDDWVEIADDAKTLLRTKWMDFKSLEELQIGELEKYCVPWRNISGNLNRMLRHFKLIIALERDELPKLGALAFDIVTKVKKLSQIFYKVPWCVSDEDIDFVYKAIHPKYRSKKGWRFLGRDWKNRDDRHIEGILLRKMRDGLQDNAALDADREILETIVQTIRASEPARSLRFLVNMNKMNRSADNDQFLLDLYNDYQCRKPDATANGVKLDEKRHGDRAKEKLMQRLRKHRDLHGDFPKAIEYDRTTKRYFINLKPGELVLITPNAKK